jgi:hypothetical protein
MAGLTPGGVEAARPGSGGAHGIEARPARKLRGLWVWGGGMLARRRKFARDACASGCLRDAKAAPSRRPLNAPKVPR